MRKELRMGRPRPAARASCFSSFRGPLQSDPKRLVTGSGNCFECYRKKSTHRFSLCVLVAQHDAETMGEETICMFC